MAIYFRRSERLNSEQYRYFEDPVLGRTTVASAGPNALAESKGVETSIYKPLSRNFSFRLSVDVGAGFFTYSSGGPLFTSIYPDSTYIASPNYILVDANDNPVRLTDAQVRDIGHRANLALQKARDAISLKDRVQENYTPLRPFSEWEDMGDEDRNRPEIQGLWQTQTWRTPLVVHVRSAPTTQASFQFLWNTPPDWGPGPVMGGSKLLGGIQANLVWRFHSGDLFRYAPPNNSTFNSSKIGPMFVRADLNFQKTFEARTVQPTIYVEVFNLFDSYVDPTSGPDYVRWGLQRPAPSNPNYIRYGDPSPFRGGAPRYVNVGVRVGF
jgi:hypothetical protein